MTGLPAVFEKYRQEIETELKEVFSGRQLPLYDMMRYHLGWIDVEGNPQAGGTGKAVRPTLCLLACEAVGGNHHRALPAAAALELVHNYSLIHDDIQDDDRERRHRPTVWSIWGKPQAINAGTAMRLLANLALRRLSRQGVSLQKQDCVQKLLDTANLRLLEGQYLDISYEDRFDITTGDYLEMIAGKTASLMAGSLEIGALLGTDDIGVVGYFAELGWKLGMSFQIRDDILGIWGSSSETGKPLGNDIRRRKKTLPVVCALENAAPNLKAEMVNIYRQEVISDDAVGRVLEILELVSASIKAQTLAEKYSQEAWQLLDKMTLTPSPRHDLEDVLSFLSQRKF